MIQEDRSAVQDIHSGDDGGGGPSDIRIPVDRDGDAPVPGPAGAGSGPGPTARRRVTRLGLLLASLILAGSVGFLAIALHPSANEEGPPSTHTGGQPPSVTAPPPVGPTAFLGEFIFDQYDAAGRLRIAFCEIALELEESQNAEQLTERVDLREAVYAVLKKGNGETRLSIEGRNQLKEELKETLNTTAGELLVKNVYLGGYELY